MAKRPWLIFALGWLAGVVTTFVSLVIFGAIAHRIVQARLDAQLAAHAPESHPTLRAIEVPRITGERISMPLGWNMRVPGTEQQVTATSFVGHPVLLNIWATWCAPCVAELLSLKSLAADFPQVRFALVSRDDAGSLARFLQQRQIGLPVYLLDQPAPDDIGVAVIPTTFILDHRGKVAFRHSGAGNWDSSSVRALLRALTDEARGASSDSHTAATPSARPRLTD